jgi:hypothetical protein
LKHGTRYTEQGEKGKGGGRGKGGRSERCREHGIRYTEQAEKRKRVGEKWAKIVVNN